MTPPPQLRVLIIDDARADAELCVHELRAGGFDVSADIVDSAEQTYALLRDRIYDIALADYNLPGWSGLDALRMLRRECPEMPVVLVTGSLGDELAVECMREGAADYVLKDRLARLLPAVRNTLESVALRQEQQRAARERDLLLQELQERVKELSTIFEVNKILARRCNLSEALTEIAGLLPKAMQVPELAHGLVRFDGRNYGPNFCRDACAASLSADLVVEGKVCGSVEGCYTEWPRTAETFLAEERNALNAIAFAVSEAIERQRAQQALRRSEAYYRSLIEHSHEVITIIDAEGIVRYESPSIEYVLGYAPLERIGRSAFDNIHPEDAPVMREFLRSGLSAPGPFAATEFRVRHKNGSWRVARTIGTNLLHDPAVEGIVLNCRDITQRKEAEAALARAHAELEQRVRERTADLARLNDELRRSRAEWEQIFNCMSDAVTYLSPDYRILRSNLAVRRLFPEADLEHAHCYELVHGTTAPPEFCPTSKTVASKQTEVCEYFEARLGRYLQVRTDPVLEDDGSMTRIVHTVSDITERRNAQELHDRLAAILQASTELVATVDGSGRIVYLNLAGRELLRIGENEISALRIADLYPGWKEHLAEHVTEDPSQGFAWSRETVLRRRDSSEVTVLLVTVLHRHARGLPDYISLVAHDITLRKEIERMKDDLVSTVSHELRTPLASLMGFTELMLHHDYPIEKQREFLETIFVESKRLSELINNFLDLQRIESGRQAYNLETLDLAPLLRESVALFESSDAQHSFAVEIPPDLPAIIAARDRLQQVIRNLLSNAVKYSPDGGTIRTGARLEGHRLLLWVRDEGIGIPPHELPRLFTRFFRGEHAARCGIRGSGLGLALCREIVRRLGGDIWAESELGHGSTFYISLPLAELQDETSGLPRHSVFC